MRLLAVLAFVPATAAAGLALLPQVGVSVLDPQAAKPPVAAQVDSVTVVHDDRLFDPYAWLRDESDPAVLDYLKAENDYAAAVMAPVADLEETLFREMVGRLVEDDRTFPTRYGDYWYQWRIEPGQDHWAYYRRTGGPDGPEQLILDVNALAEGHAYYVVLGTEVTRDGRLLAYLEDSSGGLYYDLILLNLETGERLEAGRRGAARSVRTERTTSSTARRIRSTRSRSA